VVSFEFAKQISGNYLRSVSITPQGNHKKGACKEGLFDEEANHSLASKARGSETNSTSSRFLFHLVVIPAEAGIQNKKIKIPGYPLPEPVRNRFREYDKIKQLVSRSDSCSLCSHFV